MNAVSPGWVDTPIWDSVVGEGKAGALEAMAKRLPVGRIGQRGLLDDCDAAASVAPAAGELLALANVSDGGCFEARAFLFGFEQGGVVF